MIDDGVCLICINVKWYVFFCFFLLLFGNFCLICKILEDFLEFKCISRLLVNFELLKYIIKCVIKILLYVILEDIFFCWFGRICLMYCVYNLLLCINFD